MSNQKTQAQGRNDQQLNAKALKLKIDGVNSHLESIINKKLRLDLEIRQTQKRLIRLRKLSQSMTESVNPKLKSAHSYAQLRLLLETPTDEVDAFRLSQSEDKAAELIEVVTELEPILYKNEL